VCGAASYVCIKLFDSAELCAVKFFIAGTDIILKRFVEFNVRSCKERVTAHMCGVASHQNSSLNTYSQVSHIYSVVKGINVKKLFS